MTFIGSSTKTTRNVAASRELNVAGLSSRPAALTQAWQTAFKAKRRRYVALGLEERCQLEMNLRTRQVRRGGEGKVYRSGLSRNRRGG